MTMLPPVLAEVRKRPGMYLPVTTYEAAVAFVLGYDSAINGGLLWGFREWLIVRLAEGNNLAWPGLVLELIRSRSASSAGPQSSDEQRAAVESLLAIIEEFLSERDRVGGGRRIYAIYEQWLQSQDWYGPSSPDWLSRGDE